MAWELVITSAPKGLKPGSSGFCPVLATRGIPPNLLDRLEALSGYRHQEIGSGAGRNPVVWSHTIVRLGTETYHVLSRVADAGRDYSGRSNKLAHHLVLKQRECPPGGPAALLMTPGVMRDHWDGQVGWVDREVSVPSVVVQPQPCHFWAKVWGDAGWGGILASRVLSRPNDLLYFVYPDDVAMLQLFAESLALLPEASRWRVTFTTYDLGLADIATCQWRACPASSPQAINWQKARGLEIWDLTRPRGKAPSNGAALAGRQGRILQRLGGREESAASRPSIPGQSTTLQTPSGLTLQPPDLPPILTPADNGVLPLAEQQGPPPITPIPLNRVRSSRGDKRSFWFGFAAGMACMLILSLGTMVGISLTPAGKVLSAIPGFIASKLGSGKGAGGKADDPAGKPPESGEKLPAAANPPQGAPEKQQQMPGGKAAPSPSGRGKEGSSSDNNGKVSERPNARSEGRIEETRDKNPSAAPGTSARDKRDSRSEQSQGPSESNPEKPPAKPEKASSADTTSPPAPSSETSRTPRTPVTDGKRERDFNSDPNEARLLTELVGSPVNSLVELHVEAQRQSFGPINEIVAVAVAHRSDTRPSDGSHTRLYVVQYSDRNKVPDADVFYIPPDGWPKQFRLGVKDQKEIPIVLGGIGLQLKTEHGWEGGVSEYRYRRGDKTLVILTIRGKGNGVTIETKPPDDAKEDLREPIPAKLGFWVEEGEQLPRRVWVTMVELEIVHSK